ncbi:hypothetical protein F0562_017572 [Nyssa sinensis]|uniref:Uncharacterized protein n=1 Tax=Nyssa sinensis TaxID=561372 RepID=A0A5J4ZGY2_9ASTE|nr:hypothetical protein F0562_017572 [Nyssa sinensis]
MKHHIYVTFLFLFLFNFSVVIGCHENEREALLNFKSFLTDASNRLSSWQGLNCCSWHGIYCSKSWHVVAVNLRNPAPDSVVINANKNLVSMSTSISSALKGTISSSLFTLSYLRFLDLSFNNFMSSKIPSGLSNLTSLAHLNLSNAMFEDSIVAQLANLTSLRQLDLSCSYEVPDVSAIAYNLTSLKVGINSLHSFIHRGSLYSPNLNWLEGLHNLRELRLSGVDLSEASQLNKWAEPISLLSNLKSLHLFNCRIVGAIPINHLLNLTHLYSLRMDSNIFTSPIPNQLANLSSLLIFGITHSNLGGSVPYLPQLKELYVGSNQDISINLNSMFAVPWPRLERLDIQFTRVFGSIPTSFSNTTSLVYFVADGCAIQGLIPSFIMNMTRLEWLQLNANNISGYLPPSISNLKSLKYLAFFQNSLEGSIPDSICEISSLRYLNLESNLLNGNLPDCIGQIPNLRYLYVFHNRMNGTITSLSSLFQNSTPYTVRIGFSGLTVKIDQSPFSPNFQPRVLELTSCNIGGGIPDFISNLNQLAYLSLCNNSLSGTIPPWLFTLPKLCHLDLSLNNLQGVLPPSIQLHLSWWATALILARNSLQGPIPILENIELIEFSRNNFTGNIPKHLGELSNIIYLSFSDNKLFGQIPFSFCQENSVMMHLDLSNNGLSGTVPNSLGNCTSLVSLNLGGNNFSGNIPSELEGAKNLSYLDLSGNHFDGPFPSFIQKLQMMEVLKLAHNRFDGKIPQFIGDLHNLRCIYLASNFFNGSIPEEITKLEKLQYMDFSNNELSGPIPEKIDGMKMLTSRRRDGILLGYVISLLFAGIEFDIVAKGHSYQLVVVYTYLSGIDLSCNTLSGNIPQEIGHLHGLYMLNLSHNGLSGEIPRSIAEMRGLESLDFSFNHLRGEIPTTLTWLDSLSYLNLSYNNFSEQIPRGIHFDTLYGDGSAYIGNKFLCGAPGGMNCNRSVSPSIEKIDTEDSRQDLLFSVVVGIGYAVGVCGFFMILNLMKEKWRQRYWRAIDNIVLRIVQCLRKS